MSTGLRRGSLDFLELTMDLPCQRLAQAAARKIVTTKRDRQKKDRLRPDTSSDQSR